MRPATASFVANAVATRFAFTGPNRHTTSRLIRDEFRPLRPLTSRRMSTRSPTAAAATDAAADTTAPRAVPIVQYVVLRRDLGKEGCNARRNVFLSRRKSSRGGVLQLQARGTIPTNRSSSLLSFGVTVRLSSRQLGEWFRRRQRMTFVIPPRKRRTRHSPHEDETRATPQRPTAFFCVCTDKKSIAPFYTHGTVRCNSVRRVVLSSCANPVAPFA